MRNDLRRSASENRDVALAVVLLALVAAALPLLARGLPSRTFVVGDPGLKLIAARNAIDHPGRPLEIDLPRIAGQPVEFLDPSFRIHGNHAHATTSELFPLISAPLIAAFGMRGAYVLPAIGFLLAVGATAALGVALDGRRSRLGLVAASVLCTPLLFYALEFWEHAPAVGVAALATQMFVARQSCRARFASGILLGVAVLLRPEAAWYLVALAVGTCWLPTRPRPAHVAAMFAGVAAAYLPLEVFAFAHFGQLTGGHIDRNLTGLGEDWWWDRLAMLRLWLAPGNAVWLAAGALLMAATATTRKHDGGRNAIRIVGWAFVALAAVAAAGRTFGETSVWGVAPAVLLPLVVPGTTVREGRRFLVVVTAVYFGLVALTAPNDGGSQWGPRYLLFAFVPLAVLVADSLVTPRSARSIGVIALAVVLASSAMVQRNAYRDLRTTKRIYATILGFVERHTSSGGYIVTDLWWLQQVTAALYPARVVLFIDNAGSARRALPALAREGRVAIVHDGSRPADASLERWCADAGLESRQREALQERNLTLEVVGRQ